MWKPTEQAGSVSCRVCYNFLVDSEDYRKTIEEEILKIIEEKLVAQEIDAGRAKQIAQLVLRSLHPPMTLNQIWDAVQKFDDYFPELVPAVAAANQDYNRSVEEIVSSYAKNLITQGKSNEAIALMHKALKKQIKLPD